MASEATTGDQHAARPFVTFTESVFFRPGMYTINGTVEEIVAFLGGYHSAAAKCIHHKAAVSEAEAWWNFCRWLAKRLDDTGSSWHGAFIALRRAYPDDAAAFAKLQEWYPEFLRHNG